MVLFTAENATVDQKCAIAHELLDGFAKVPVFFPCDRGQREAVGILCDAMRRS
jgi:hypothetical protein